MKAVRIYSYGGSDRLKVEDMHRPRITDEEVLVKIHDAGVNPVDWKIREGFMKHSVPAAFPLTMGQDFSGEVMEVGKHVSQFQLGDEVFGFAHGSYAEYAAVSTDQIAIMPESVDFATAASLPTAGLTAWQVVTDAAQLRPDHRVLIHGAAGGVGSFAVQIAKWIGSRVTATAAREDISYLKSLGVDQVIDYKKERFEEKVRDFDTVIDLVGGETLARSYPLVKEGGVLVTTVGPISESEGKKRGIRNIQFMMKSDARGLAQIAQLVDEMVIRPRVSEVLPLVDAKRAQDLSQKGHPHGKIVLEVT